MMTALQQHSAVHITGYVWVFWSRTGGWGETGAAKKVMPPDVWSAAVPGSALGLIGKRLLTNSSVVDSPSAPAVPFFCAS